MTTNTLCGADGIINYKKTLDEILKTALHDKL